jgi:hypothetical protein
MNTLYEPKPLPKTFKNYEKVSIIMRENFDQLKIQDNTAKQNGTLVGRYIQEGVADGYAYYQIVKEGKNTVKIRQVTGVGDDWMVSYWGREASIKKSYAKQMVKMRDGLEEIFG